MAMRGFVAMTAAEFLGAPALPGNPAWMACHFSCYGTGLSNLPQQLPRDAMIILNDRTPIHGHDPSAITDQLLQLCESLHPWGFLLDFQRPDNKETEILCQTLAEKLPCPVGISHYYASPFCCPVFLPPPPLHKPLSDYISPWAGREIWLEAAIQAQTMTITTEGCHIQSSPADPLDEPKFFDAKAYSSYHTELSDDRAVFSLLRGEMELKELLANAQVLGISLTIGLYQQLGPSFFS